MKKIREVLKSKSGQGVPMILAVVLCCLILACVTFEYMRLMIVAQGAVSYTHLTLPTICSV